MPDEPDPPLWRLVRIPAWLIWQPFRLVGIALVVLAFAIVALLERLPERRPWTWLIEAGLAVAIFCALVGTIISDKHVDDWSKD